jgi:hypothetical protein
MCKAIKSNIKATSRYLLFISMPQKNEACFKSGHNLVENNHLATLT